MVFQIARLMVVGFVVLTVVYIVASLYSRSVRREKLEKQWDAEIGTGDRDAYIREGMEAYRGSLRRKLLWGVYIVPMAVLLVLLYANFM